MGNLRMAAKNEQQAVGPLSLNFRSWTLIICADLNLNVSLRPKADTYALRIKLGRPTETRMFS